MLVLSRLVIHSRNDPLYYTQPCAARGRIGVSQEARNSTPPLSSRASSRKLHKPLRRRGRQQQQRHPGNRGRVSNPGTRVDTAPGESPGIMRRRYVLCIPGREQQQRRSREHQLSSRVSANSAGHLKPAWILLMRAPRGRRRATQCPRQRDDTVRSVVNARTILWL